MSELHRKQNLLLCKWSGGVSIESAPLGPGDGRELVQKDDGLHLMMNEKTHDFGLIIDRADNMLDAILKAQEWRAVVAVMES